MTATMYGLEGRWLRLIESDRRGRQRNSEQSSYIRGVDELYLDEIRMFDDRRSLDVKHWPPEFGI